MNPVPPVELIEQTAKRLGNLTDQVTFLGGAVVALLVTDLAARPVRATKDVDVAIELASRTASYELEEALRLRGFRNAIEGPICRFIHGPYVLDIMPTASEILGFTNRWYSLAIHTAERKTLSNEVTINLITPACFLATKMEAFDSPTRLDHGDMYASRDFEDIVTLIDGSPDIAEKVISATNEVKHYLQERFRRQMNDPRFDEGLEAHLEDGRVDIVLQRIHSFVSR